MVQLMGTAQWHVRVPNGDSLDLHQRNRAFSTLIASSSNEWAYLNQVDPGNNQRKAEAAFSAVCARACMWWRAIIYNSTFLESTGLRAFLSFI